MITMYMHDYYFFSINELYEFITQQLSIKLIIAE